MLGEGICYKTVVSIVKREILLSLTSLGFFALPLLGCRPGGGIIFNLHTTDKSDYFVKSLLY